MNEWVQQAQAAHKSGRLVDAARLYGEALRVNPRDFDALYLLGILHMQRNEFAEAEQRIGDALKINPRSLDGQYNRGRALQRLDRHEDALDCFEAGLRIWPSIPELLLARGNALMQLHRPQDALAGFEVALRLKPDSVEIWNSRANALAVLERPLEALASYDKALGLGPKHPGILHHRALTLFEQKRYQEAARDFADVLKIDPNFEYARGNLIYAKRHCCDWRDLAEEEGALAKRFWAGEQVVTPIQSAALAASPDEQLLSSLMWTAHKHPSVAQKLWRGERYAHEKIRIAYLSADFHSHATAALMAGVFESHDRNRFETFAISYGIDDKSEMRARLKPAFDRFADMRKDTDLAIAKYLRQMEIDIAVDLKGYTQDARPGILSHRPAPVQASYLGFPGTMGSEDIDYFIADRIVVPPEHVRHYSEKIVYLPDTYQCNDDKRAIAERPLSRAEAGLPERGFVFCSFNNNFKITPGMFDVWMRLLSSVEGSVLWLLQDNADAMRNLKREAEARGVAAARLVFAPRANLDYHLARHRLADLFLDTLPYGAHTTASDALWAGLPVLTCLGATFAGRVAASLLHAVGLPETAVGSLDDYEALALKLARDPTALAALKDKLRSNRKTQPLFDTVRFTRHLEAAYVGMWERAQSGHPPESFASAAPVA